MRDLLSMIAALSVIWREDADDLEAAGELAAAARARQDADNLDALVIPSQQAEPK